MNKRISRISLLLLTIVLVLTQISCSTKKAVTKDSSSTFLENSSKENKTTEVDDTTKTSTTTETTSSVTNSNNSGRYMEEGLKLPKLTEKETFFTWFVNTNKEVEYYTSKFNEIDSATTYSCYILKDGAWLKQEIPWVNQIIKDGFPIQNIFLGEDGNYYALTATYSVTGNSTITEDTPTKSTTDSNSITNSNKVTSVSYLLFKANEDLSSYIDFTPDIWKHASEASKLFSERNTIECINVLKNETIVYSIPYNNTIMAYSMKNKETLNFTKNQIIGDFVAKENTLYFTVFKENKIVVYNMDKVTLENEISTDSLIENENFRLTVKNDGTLYLQTKDGIHRFVLGGTLWETIVDGSINNMSTPNTILISFLLLEGNRDEFYTYSVTIQENTKELYARYYFDENVSATLDKQLTIYSLWDNETIRFAISNFQKKHSDVRIKYIVAMNEESSATITEQIHALNTEVLAGKGADLFLLDGLPMDSYIDKNVLLDISDIISPKIEDGTLLKNIINQYQYNGKVYSLPIRFGVPFLITDDKTKTVLGSLNELAKYSRKCKQTKLVSGFDSSQFFLVLLYTYYSQIVNEDGTINSDKFLDFIKNSKTITDNAGPEYEYNEYTMDYRGFYSPQSNIPFLLDNSPFSLVSNKVHLAYSFTNNVSDLILKFAIKNQISGYISSINNTFVPNGIIGINKSSTSTDLAKDFLTFLISEEVQSENMNDGYPINQASLNEWITENQSGMEMKTSTRIEDGTMVDVEGGWPSEEDRQLLKDILCNVNQPITNDTVVIQMIMEESIGYFNGTKTAEQATKDVIHKVNLYLQE